MSRPLSGPDDPRHGTLAGYTRLRCREECCRTVGSAAKARWRARQTPPPEGDPRHGKASTYRDMRCRCDPCTAAATRANGIVRKSGPDVSAD